MFQWLRRPAPAPDPSPRTVVDLRLDKATPAQSEALAAAMALVNDLVTKHGFTMIVQQGDGGSYVVEVSREIRDAHRSLEFACRVEVSLCVQEDQRDRRYLDNHSRILLDGVIMSDDTAAGRLSGEASITPAGAARMRSRVELFIERARGAGVFPDRL